MSGPKTSWEDLSNLGWFKQQVYNKLNSVRGGTMEGFGDMALNEGFATDYGWYSYNLLHGDPRVGGKSVDHIESSTIVWSYDNTQNSEPFGPTQWTETWTNSETASLSISTHAGVSLSQSITIPGVGDSSFSISISTDSNKTETKEASRQLSNTWDITVGAHEKVSIERVRTIRTGQAVYLQDYGLSDNSFIGTKGRKWNDHYYWGFRLNYYLNNPQGTIRLNGSSVDEGFTFKIIRVGPDGKRRAEPLPPPKEEIKAFLAAKAGDSQFPSLIAGPE